MSMNGWNFVPRALAVLGLLFGVSLVGSASHAEEIIKVRPAENMDAPIGSQIPERRIQESQAKMKEYMQKMRAERAKQQQQEQKPEEQSPKPEN
ncbi:MAG: hypothetical protein QNJ94_08905 [Alphaproteobacteria bacterium]|nr:hypothetical protein [Alphaproteobacteria bacterium]